MQMANCRQARPMAAGDIDKQISTWALQAWNVLNLHTSYTLNFVTVDLGLQNIFNEDYSYHGSGVNGYEGLE